MATDRPVPLPPCRRCSECVGLNHHWLDGEGAIDGIAETYYGCKHCGLTCRAVDDEDGLPIPDESIVFCACGNYPATDCGLGCKEYPDA